MAPGMTRTQCEREFYRRAHLDFTVTVYDPAIAQKVRFTAKVKG